MRVLLVLAVFGFLATGAARAQGAHSPYVGVGAVVLPAFGGVLPLLTVQAGTPIVDILEARVKLDTVFSFNLVEADLLVTLPVGAGFKPYLGAGAAYAFPGSGYNFDAIVTAGLEYAPGGVGFFGEAQAASSALLNGIVEPFYRFGVNFHF